MQNSTLPTRCAAVAFALILTWQPASRGEEELDRASVYRVNPPGQQLVVVAREEVKHGFAYKYFNEHLGRHVWGLAAKDGRFQFAMGPGSMQPTDQFDLRLSATQQQQILEEQAPGLFKGVAETGRQVYLELGEDDRWQLYQSTSIPKVFDLLTSRRWEWHGGRQVAVLHTTGYLWEWLQGRYYPLQVVFH